MWQVSVFGTNIRGSPFRLVMQHANITSATPSYRSDMFTESDQQRQAAHNSRSEAHEDRSELVSSRQPLSSPVHEVGYGSRLDGSPAARSSFNHTAQSPAFGVTGNSGGASSRLQAARERVIRARQLQEQARNREKSPPRAEPRTQGRTTAQHASPTQVSLLCVCACVHMCACALVLVWYDHKGALQRETEALYVLHCAGKQWQTESQCTFLICRRIPAALDCTTTGIELSGATTA